jgi:hypothetical protein
MFNMFKKQGTSKRSASTSSIIGDREPGDMATPTTGEQAIAGDMAIAGACEELSDAQLATCGGGADPFANANRDLEKLYRGGIVSITQQNFVDANANVDLVKVQKLLRGEIEGGGIVSITQQGL